MAKFVKTGALPLQPDEPRESMWDAMKRTELPKREESMLVWKEKAEPRKEKRKLGKTRREESKIKEFRKKRAEKEKKEEPARAMAQEIVQTVQENANNIINNDPILDDELLLKTNICAKSK